LAFKVANKLIDMNKSFLLLIVTVLFIGLQTQAQTLKDRSGTSTTSTQTTTNTNTETAETSTSTTAPVATNSNSTTSTYSQQIADKVTDVLGDRINLSDSQKNQMKNTGATWIDKLWDNIKNLNIKNPFKK